MLGIKPSISRFYLWNLPFGIALCPTTVGSPLLVRVVFGKRFHSYLLKNCRCQQLCSASVQAHYLEPNCRWLGPRFSALYIGIVLMSSCLVFVLTALAALTNVSIRLSGLSLGLLLGSKGTNPTCSNTMRAAPMSSSLRCTLSHLCRNYICKISSAGSK